jgi:hypothetical protein
MILSRCRNSRTHSMNGRVNNMKWIGTLFVVLFALSLPAYAQTAKVIALSSADAATAKQLHDDRVAAEKRESDFRVKIQKTYLVEPQNPSPKGGIFSVYSACTSNILYRTGWGCGKFEFSDDFKFVVPKTSAPQGIILGGGNNGCCTSYGSNGTCWNYIAPAFTTTPLGTYN